MKQTPNYNLTQWEKEDRIQMERFNEDNAAVDAALAGLAQTVAGKADLETVRAELPWVKLGEATLSAKSTQVAVTVPNAEQYQNFLIFFDTSGSSQMNLIWSGYGSYTLRTITDWTVMSRFCGMFWAAVMPKGGVFLWCAHESTAGDEIRAYSGGNLLGSAASSGSVTIAIQSRDAEQLAAGSWLQVYALKKQV